MLGVTGEVFPGADRVMAAQCWVPQKPGPPATAGGALPENAMERVDIATDQIGFRNSPHAPLSPIIA